MIVKYSKKFPYAPYLNEDIGFDKSIPDNATEEEMIQAIVDLNRTATAAFYRLNPVLSPSLPIQEETGAAAKPKEINLEAERVMILIENATSIQELTNYWPSAERYGLQNQYYDKVESLDIKNK